MTTTIHSPATGLDACMLEARRLASAALAAALRDPRGPGDATPPVPADALRACWRVLQERHGDVRQGDLGLGEAEPRRADPEPLMTWLALDGTTRAQSFDRVFGLVVSRECPGYETEYCSSRDAFHRAQHMADLNGFFRAFGLQPDPRRPERPDHASNHLCFVAFLLEKLGDLANAPATPQTAEHSEVCAAALGSFVNDHVLWWMPTFARCLEARVRRLLEGVNDAPQAAALSALAGVARLLRSWVAVERLEGGLPPHRRIEAPAIEEPDLEPDTCGECGGCADPGPATSVEAKEGG